MKNNFVKGRSYVIETNQGTGVFTFDGGKFINQGNGKMSQYIYLSYIDDVTSIKEI